MGRLTYRGNNGKGYVKNQGYYNGVYAQLEIVAERLTAYEDTGLEPDEVDQICRAAQTMMFESVSDFVRYAIANFEVLQTYRSLGAVEELSALVEARDEGRVVVLPCKPSDVTVYQLRGKKHALGVGVSPRHISCATVWGNGGYALQHQGADDCLKKDFGKTWFLTRAEAEGALSAQKGDAHETDPV